MDERLSKMEHCLVKQGEQLKHQNDTFEGHETDEKDWRQRNEDEHKEIIATQKEQDQKLQEITLVLSKQKGFFGGIAFAITGIATFITGVVGYYVNK